MKLPSWYCENGNLFKKFSDTDLSPKQTFHTWLKVCAPQPACSSPVASCFCHLENWNTPAWELTWRSPSIWCRLGAGSAKAPRWSWHREGLDILEGLIVSGNFKRVTDILPLGEFVKSPCLPDFCVCRLLKLFFCPRRHEDITICSLGAPLNSESTLHLG